MLRSLLTLAVLAPLGRRVAVLHDGPVGPGEQTVTWAASGAPSGVYLVRVHRGGRTQTLRLVKR